MEFAECFSAYRNYLNPSLAGLLKFMGFEAVEDRARGPYVYDTEGREYIDCLGGFGVFSFGHSPPTIVSAVREQLEKMPLSSRLLFSEPAARLAQRLAEVTPGDLTFSFFCNSGSEAIEGALKLARFYTRRSRILSAHNSFHGKTLGALSASGREVYKAPFRPLLPDFEQVPFDDPKALEEAVDERTAAVILEPIQGEGGVVIPGEGYLARAREISSAAGALLILDEVQTGMGRTGTNFACEREGVVPDILCLGKALGGGVMPIGAFIARPEVWTMFDENPLLHSSTFGGNPLACAAGFAAVEMLLGERLAERAETVGRHFLDRLAALADQYSDLVEGVSGRGLLIGMKFRDADLGALVISGLAARRILAAYTLNNPQVVRFEPPLIIGEDLIDRVIQAVSESLAQTRELVPPLRGVGPMTE